MTDADRATIASSPKEKFSFRIGKATERPQQITVVVWPKGVDLSRFTPIDDPRFKVKAYFDTPPDPEWNASVILETDAGTNVFVNGRNLDKETVLALAASVEIGGVR